MSKKISQLQDASRIDSTTYVPIIMGDPEVNRKISAEKLIAPTYTPIDEIANELVKLAYVNQLSNVKNSVIGMIEFNSEPPIGENGKYEFTNGGVCPWITSGETVVFTNDQVLVTSTGSTYEYTYIPIVSSYATPSDIDSINQILGTKYDGVFAENGLLYFTIGGNVVGQGIEVGTGGSGAAAGTTVIARVTSGYANTFSVSSGSEAILHYTFSSVYSDTLEPTGDGTAVYSVNGIQKSVKTIHQGENEFNIGNYLSDGSNRIAINITDVNGTVRVVQFTVTLVSISISSTFNDATINDGNVTFKYTPIGKQEKTIKFFIDGVLFASATTVSSGNQLTQILPEQTHGGHTIDVYAEATVSGTIVRSNILHYEVIWATAGVTTPIITSSFNTLSAEQYSTINIPYIVYDPMRTTSTVTYTVDGTLVSTLQNVGREKTTWSYRTYAEGTLTMVIACGLVSKTFVIEVAGSSVTVKAEINNLELYLTSAGRNNNEINRNEWVSSGITGDLTDFTYGSTDGWVIDDDGNTALRVSGNARVNIPINIFASDFKPNGKTIEFEFATRNITNYDSIVISSMSGNKGIEVTTQDAILSSEQTSISAKFKEDERVRISFSIEKSSENRLIYTYINGIMSGVAQYEADDNFIQASPSGITIGSTGCTTDVYNIRVYDTNLNSYQILDNYIADIDDIDKKITIFERNEILDDNNNLVYDSVLEQLPCMILTGTLPTYKGDKQSISINYKDVQDPAKSFDAVCKEGKTNIDVQGTSSQDYPRKNFKLSFDKSYLYINEATGATYGSLYKLRDDSVPVPVFTIKADFAESSGTHNTGLAKVSENLLRSMNYLTPPQKTQYDASGLTSVNIRTTVDGFPIVVYHRATENSPITFLGKYNFNLDKGSTDAFGFTDENVHESWEYLNNTSPRCLFRSSDFTSIYTDPLTHIESPEWMQDFEARYPDGKTDTTNLQEVVNWVLSTSGNTEMFKNEAAEHFNINNMLSYFLITEMFGMVDQRAKNQFLTTWGNEGSGSYKWYFILYDNDTTLGVNNEGVNLFPYNIEYHDTLGGAKVWNGETSLLWQQVESAFAAELQAMYHEMRTSGSISYSSVLNILNNEQSGKWAEEIYNADGKFKYIIPGIDDGNWTYLYAAQGSRSEHRKWWLYNRFKYIDSKYSSGDYQDDTITMRLYTPTGSTTEAVEPSPNFIVKPIADQYCRVKYGSYESGVRGYAETPIAIIANVPSGTTFNDTETILYGASRLKDIGSLANKYSGTLDVSKATKLDKLLIGSSIDGYKNENLTSLNIGNNKLLKIIDIQNCSSLTTSLGVTGCTGLEEIYAKGSSITSVSLPDSGSLRIMQLPETITSINIKNQSVLGTGFTIDSVENLKTIRIENSQNMDIFSLLHSCAILPTFTLERVRIIGLSGTTTDVESLIKVKDCGGIASDNTNLPNAVITGNIIVPDITDEDWLTLSSAFPELIINKLITFEDPDTEAIVVANWDSDLNGIIYSSELTNVSSLNGVFMNQTNVDSFHEFRYFLGIYNVTDDFYGCTSLTGITLPSNVTTIGTGSFDGFSNLLSINYPSSLVTIGSQAFRDCVNLSGTLNLTSNLRNIGEQAFKNCTSLTGDLVLPSNVKNVSGESFYSCTGLNGTLTIPTSLLTIGNSAFYNCSNLIGSIVIPTLTTSIGSSAFENCGELNGTLTIGRNVTTLGSSAFKNCTKLNGILTLPSSLTNIQDSTFYNDKGFTGILVLPSNLLTIGNSAFYNCSGFTGTLTIPSKVTSVGNDAFYQCFKFNGNLSLPMSLTSIGSGSFNSCTGLTGVLSLPANLANIGSYAFNNCSGFTGALTIPSGITSISDYTFNNCTGFNGKVFMYDNVTTIGEHAFNNCNKITGLTISESLTTIGDSAFNNCTNLSGKVEIPSGITSIGVSAFTNCNKLSSIAINAMVPPTLGEGAFDGSNCDIVIPTGTYNAYISGATWSGYTERFIEAFGFSDDEVERILVENWDANGNLVMDPEEIWSVTGFTTTGDSTNAFEGNTLIKVFNELPQFTGLTMIHDYEFSGCTNLSSTKLPDNITSIGIGAFEDCTGLIRVMTIPNKVTSIGSSAFKNCINVPGDMTIPSGVTIINTSTFENCGSLTSLTLPSTLLTVDSKAFYNCSGLTGNLTIPSGVTSVASDAFYNCSGLNGALVIPDSVLTIGASAFYNCNALTSIVVKSVDVPTIGLNVFYGSTCDILVPMESLDVYKTDGSWSAYSGRTYGYINFVDKNVENVAVSAGWDTDNNTVIAHTEAESISSLANKYTSDATITSFDELKYFTGLDTIDSYSFSGCINLTGVTLPSNITGIETRAFYNCTSLEQSINPEITGITNIDEYAFYNCINLTGTLDLSNNMTNIGQYAFYNCNKLTGNLNIPTGLTMVKQYSYYGCSGLNGNLTIPANVNEIGIGAFMNCSNITGNLIIPSGVTSIGDSAFKGCSSFSGGLTLPTGLTSIASNVFSGCNNFTGTLTIPKPVQTIGNNSFFDCSGFNSLTINDNVNSIGTDAFNNNSNLNNITIRRYTPPTITSSGVFNNTNNCAIYIPMGTKSTYSTQSYWSGYTSRYSEYIVFQDPFTESIALNPLNNFDTNHDGMLMGNEISNITDIGTVFNVSGVTTFDELQYFTGVTSIGYSAFNSHPTLVSIRFPETLTYIDYRAFSSCAVLTSINIPKNLVAFGSHSFYGCVNLNSRLIIPETCINMGSYTFENCSSLASFIMRNETPCLLGASSLQNTASCPIYVPSGSINSYIGATGWNSMEGGLPAPQRFVEYIKFADETVNDILISDPTYDVDSNLVLTESEVSSITTLKNHFTNNTVITSFNELSGFTGIQTLNNTEFDSCTNLTGVTLPTGLTTIGVSAFRECHNLSGQLNLPNTLTSIGASAYYNCYNVNGNLTLPTGLTTIGASAFYNCTSLVDQVIIPSGVTSIEYNVFYGCDSITGVTIPSGVTTVKDYSFHGCLSLTNVTIEATTPPVLGISVFDDVNASCLIHVPTGTLTAYQTSWGAYSSMIVEG